MIGLRTPHRKKEGDEAEKPFWISYSDLMTALMVLFLVAMSVSLFSITQKVVSGPEEHRKKIQKCMVEVDAMTKREFPGVQVKGHSIVFGTLALFKTDSHRLDTAAEETLRAYVPKVLALARSEKCKGVFRRVIVEGFASQSGTYIYNLNLSLQRAERVLCALLQPSVDGALSEKDRRDVRNLFLVGGSSFNALKSSPTESQRIELKLEFLAFEDPKEVFRDAPLDEELLCPLDQ
jgi:hypothetical protein